MHCWTVDHTHCFSKCCIIKLFKKIAVECGLRNLQKERFHTLSLMEMIRWEMEASRSTLAEVWARSFEVWVDYPGNGKQTLYLGPMTGDLHPIEFPPSCQLHHFFAITAFNPHGLHTEMKQNMEKNMCLEEELRVTQPSPAFMFHSYGFLDKHREDGFTLAYPLDSADEARKSVLFLAKKYSQGAIYEYRPISKFVMLRKTVAAIFGAEVERNVEVCITKKL